MPYQLTEKTFVDSNGQVVPEGHPTAVAFVGAEGDKISNDDARKYGLLPPLKAASADNGPAVVTNAAGQIIAVGDVPVAVGNPTMAEAPSVAPAPVPTEAAGRALKATAAPTATATEKDDDSK